MIKVPFNDYVLLKKGDTHFLITEILYLKWNEHDLRVYFRTLITKVNDIC